MMAADAAETAPPPRQPSPSERSPSEPAEPNDSRWPLEARSRVLPPRAAGVGAPARRGLGLGPPRGPASGNDRPFRARIPGRSEPAPSSPGARRPAFAGAGAAAGAPASSSRLERLRSQPESLACR